MKTAVLGAGVSGLSIALKLQEKGDEVIVYEKCSKAGGLAKTRITNGYVYDPHGGHIFNSKHKEVVDWIFNYLPKENWQYNVRNAKIFFNGKYVSYPFELSLCELDPEDAVNCAVDFIQSQQGEEPDNFRDWLIWNFGKSIADYYMIPYNTKIWAYPLEKMETGWMRGKMPLPDKKELMRSLLLKDSSERKMPHSTFYYPLYGGIQTMIDSLSKPLKIKIECPVEKLESVNSKWFVNGEGPYDRIISTIPLPVVAKVMELPFEIVSAVGDLKYNSLTTVLFDCPKTDISWLYIPDSKYRAHRVGYQSALTPYAVPNKNGSGALEIIGPKFNVDKGIINNTVIPKELNAKSMLDYEFTEYAYVIHDLNYRKNTNTIKEYFNGKNGFYLLGRWATWNYNNMDMCMLDAFRLAERL